MTRASRLKGPRARARARACVCVCVEARTERALIRPRCRLPSAFAAMEGIRPVTAIVKAASVGVNGGAAAATAEDVERLWSFCHEKFGFLTPSLICALRRLLRVFFSTAFRSKNPRTPRIWLQITKPILFTGSKREPLGMS